MRVTAALLLTSLVLVAAQVTPVQGAPTSPVGATTPTQAVTQADESLSFTGIPSMDAVPAFAKTRPASAVKRAPLKVVAAVEPPSVQISKVPARTVTPTRSCKHDDLKLAWPLAGTPGKTFTTQNYTDQERGPGIKDYKGGVGPLAIAYDEHRGYDIDVGSFREMDGNTVLARAAAPGRVVDVVDSNFDRNMSCTGDSNYVLIEHANGFVSYYKHLKKSSAKVKPNDLVLTGQALGVVGSSGCSTHAHLHFEVHDCANNWLDPSKHGMWTVSPTSLEVSGVLDVMLRVAYSYRDYVQDVQIIDPKPNPTTIKNSERLFVMFSAAMREGDVFTGGVFTTRGAPQVGEWSPTGRFQHRFVNWADYTFGDYTGPAYISIFVNGQLKAIRMITVTAP